MLESKEVNPLTNIEKSQIALDSVSSESSQFGAVVATC